MSNNLLKQIARRSVFGRMLERPAKHNIVFSAEFEINIGTNNALMVDAGVNQELIFFKDLVSQLKVIDSPEGTLVLRSADRTVYHNMDSNTDLLICRGIMGKYKQWRVYDPSADQCLINREGLSDFRAPNYVVPQMIIKRGPWKNDAKTIRYKLCITV